jgi:hypothetical protein
MVAAGVLAIGSVISLVFMTNFSHDIYNVWSCKKAGEAEYAKAESTRKIKILESLANLESAKNQALSEVERAKGMAEANRIVGSSLTDNENYLKYLWIQSMEHTMGQVIYVPTEAGLPILEAGKRR